MALKITKPQKRKRVVTDIEGYEKLTPSQKRKLEEHALYHTRTHLKLMVKKMNQGETFSESYVSARNKVGN